MTRDAIENERRAHATAPTPRRANLRQAPRLQGKEGLHEPTRVRLRRTRSTHRVSLRRRLATHSTGKRTTAAPVTPSIFSNVGICETAKCVFVVGRATRTTHLREEARHDVEHGANDNRDLTERESARARARVRAFDSAFLWCSCVAGAHHLRALRREEQRDRVAQIGAEPMSHNERQVEFAKLRKRPTSQQRARRADAI